MANQSISVSSGVSTKLFKLALLILLSCLFIRICSLGLYPLMDTTEARYGEMARIMAESNDWITPMFDYGVPFWGKPPMFTWLSGLGFEVFGVNEFAARLPHLLVGCLTLWVVWIFARSHLTASSDLATHLSRNEQSGQRLAWLAVAILASTASFIIISGAVMTDAGLMLSVSLSMIAFWFSWKNGARYWGYLFFLGLALGMLTKGPLAIVLVGISLTIWLTLSANWKAFFRRYPYGNIPWLSGTLLFLIVSLPWYIAAEIKTPGFLDYFIVGEHVKRFLISGWEGDLYGTAHKRPRGTIWLLWLSASLPWFPILFLQMFKLKKSPKINTSDRSLRIFLWSWLLAPLLLFTFSGNILWSYVLPGIPAMALLIVLNQQVLKLTAKHYVVGLVMPIALGLLVIAMALGFEVKSSEKNLLNTWRTHSLSTELPLYYLNKRPFSGQFYSDGEAKIYTGDPAAMTEQYFMVSRKKSKHNTALQDQCEALTDNAKHTLWLCK